MAVPNTFATATSPLPLSELDTNFATPITLGSTAVALGDTVTSVTGLNTTGNAGNVTGTVAIANGGTGQATASAAFNALSPVTATGDLIVGNGTNSATRLGIGTNGYVLTSNGTAPTWSAAGGVSSFSAGSTGLTPSTATTGAVTLAGTLAVTNGGTGVTTSTGSGANVLGTSPTITTPTISSLSSAAATALTLQSAGTTAITVDTSQNVGIGTSSPGAKLDVNPSSGTIFRAFTNGVSQILIGNGGASTNYFDGNTQIFRLGNATETARIDSSGNVGIGTASPISKLDARGSAYLGADSNVAVYAFSNSTEGRIGVGGRSTVSNVPLTFYVADGGSNTERMRIDTSGNLQVGTTGGSSANNTNSFAAIPASGGGYILVQHASGSASGFPYAYFGYNTSVIGSITQNGTTGVLYNLTSDYRLKNNPVALTGAKNFVMALQPKKWQWWDGSGEGVGFIAHEFMEVAKYSGQGEKDAVDADGKPIHQSIQPSSSEVMANIVALMQEQQTTITAQAETINALTARITALENA